MEWRDRRYVKPVDNLVTTKFKSEFKADIRGYFPGVDPGHNATLQWKLDDQPIDKASGGEVKLSNATKPQTLSDIAFDDRRAACADAQSR